VCEVLSEFPQFVLPIPFNVCISVTSRHNVVMVMASQLLDTVLLSSYSFWADL